MLMTAPRASSMQMERIMSMSEYIATPKVAANRPMPLTMIDGAEVPSAMDTDSRFVLPEPRSDL